jgi:transcription initiation factor TFIIB
MALRNGATKVDSRSSMAKVEIKLSADRNSSKEKNGTLALDAWRQIARVSDQTEKNFAFALTEITRIGCALSLPATVLEKAAVLYKTLVEKQLTRGRPTQAISCAILYVACRQCGLVRAVNEIAEISQRNRREIAKYYRFILTELNLTVAPSSLNGYAPRVLDELAVSQEVAKLTCKILSDAERLKIAHGRSPVAILSAAIYLASKSLGMRKTQREIAEATRVTEVTIRNTCKELLRQLTIIISV